MAGKYELVTKLYEDMASSLTGDIKAWRDFLKCSVFNYNLRFDEQVLLYAQKPEARAVATIEVWNRRFKRWVNKGAKGIAVFDNLQGDNQRLKHYFDISDTHEGQNAVKVPIWSMNKTYEEAVIETLEASFGSLEYKKTIELAIYSAIDNAVTDNIGEYLDSLKEARYGSRLEGLDEDNLKMTLCDAAAVSASYMIMVRLNADESFFDFEDFSKVAEFNTKNTFNVLGFAVSDISGMALSEIAKTVRSLQAKDNRTFDDIKKDRYNKEKESERSGDDENRISDAGRLYDAGSYSSEAGGSEPWKMGTSEKELPSKSQESDILQSVDFSKADRASTGNRDSSKAQDETDNRADERTGEDNRRAESSRYDGLGRGDEQHQEEGRGDSLSGADTKLEYHDRKTGDKNLPFFYGNKDIISILKTSPHLKAEKSQIRLFFEAERDKDEQISYIKSIFNNDYTELILEDGRRAGYKTYENVLHLWEGSYLSRTREGFYDWGVIADYFDSMRLLGLLYDDVKPLPSLEGQISLMQEENEPLGFTFSQEIIDLALTGGSGIREGKYRVYEQFSRSLSQKENIDFLKKEYGWGGRSSIKAGLGIGEMHDAKGIHLSRDDGDKEESILLKWPDAEKRIRELIGLNRYLNPKEKEHYNRWLLKREEERDESNEKQDILQENNSKTLTQRLVSFAKETDPYGFYENFSEDVTEKEILDSFAELLDSRTGTKDVIDNIKAFSEDNDEYLELAGELIDELSILYSDYEYSLGDKVYIGSGEYEILSITDDTVRLYDYSFPLINKEFDRNGFEEKIRENPSNDHLIKGPVISDVVPKMGLETVNDDTEKLPPKPEKERIDTEELEPEEILPRWEQKKSSPREVSIIYPEIKDSERINYRITDDEPEYRSSREKLQDNLLAIELIKRLESEKRLAGSGEQEILSRYTGWGGLADVFDKDKPAWHDEYMRLRELLTDEEYSLARESTLTAFYTPPVVISAMYKAIENMGFTEGNILEPSCGIGNFMGLIPQSMSKSRIYGVELDSITGSIARQLYQKSPVMIKGFEDVKLHDSFFDIAIGNVPFGDFKVADKRYDKHNFLIHDYFFAKTIDKVRPGGIIAFITSKGTMDKKDPKVRKYIARHAELIGAVRLPNDTFSKNAGTQVTSDIIFLQKRDRVIDIIPEWVYTEKDENGITINSYYISHPEMILGQMVEKQGRFGPESVCIPYEDRPLKYLLEDATSNINGQITQKEIDDIGEEFSEEAIVPADPDVRNFSYALHDGQIYFREDSIMSPVKVSKTAERRIRYMIELRDITRELIYYQTEDFAESDIKEKQRKLGEKYDSFTKKYGLINSRANSSAFSMDSSYNLLCALEVLDEEGTLIRKADIFTKRTIRPERSVKSVDTAPEALALSIAEKAGVDVPFMMQLTGKEESEIVEELKSVIFLDPDETHLSDGEEIRVYKTADEYLSGNVRAKLRIAEKIAEADSRYESNVNALKEIQPEEISAGDISVRLGATWLPEDVVADFIFELLDTPNHARWNIKVMYSHITGEWRINGKNYDRANVKAYNTYGSGRINAYKIIENTLNLRDVRVFDYVVDDEGRKKPILNKKETAIAKAKQEQIKTAFSQWIWNEPERREKLTKLYNEKFNSIRTREYDGSHIAFTGMNPEIRLKKHQVNAVARILYGGNTLLAHAVGAGKSATRS